MTRLFTALIGFCITLAALQAQTGNLGLHGKVTWLGDNRIRVEYDWSDDSQLLDWTPTDGSVLIRGNGTLTISGGTVPVHSMILKQPMKCTRINAQNAKSINAETAHLNFITNVAGWNGVNFNPPEIIGVIYNADANYWLENESYSSFGARYITSGTSYNVEITIEGSTITAKSSLSGNTYTHSLDSPADPDREVAVGGWGGDTEWGTLTIEGEVNTTWQPRADMIDIQSCGASFAPVIEVTGNPQIEWIFYDGTTSSAAGPSKNYGSPGIRHNLLKVTPWSALIGINAGYDGADGGYGGFARIAAQHVRGFSNLSLAGEGLQYICANYSPLAELDLRGLNNLRFVEMYLCQNLNTVRLGNHPFLERICTENCNLTALDISGCPSLKDLRAANNNYRAINWGGTGSMLEHICVRSNPQITENIPELSRFTMLRELLIWDAGQTGSLVCHSPVIRTIEAYNNHYSDADVSGCTVLEQLQLSGSRLASIDVSGVKGLILVELKDCGLAQPMVDHVLKTLDEAGWFEGTLDLSGNSAPSAAGMTHYNNLTGREWTVSITDPGQKIPVQEITVTGENGSSAISTDNGALQLTASVWPVYASDKSLTWSVVNGARFAEVDANGRVKALKNGSAKVRATANDGSGIYGEITITITNQSAGDIINYNIGSIIVSATELQILFEQDFTSWKASIYNLSGNIVVSRMVDGSRMTFDISRLTPGLYIIAITRGNSVRVAEFVKP
ncbi:MAG TPA: Ig-like domain-containing protein [Bacteroidales bacterium]|nr:T9SS type A sorting domain-containing protein [Bacteroidales bacterium]HNR42853.1 Ig-like domain-containing protein [Bacteroidales bacterium]HPM19001.1 Ig-like domain-containing protein [Bacteroidales bacterium]